MGFVIVVAIALGCSVLVLVVKDAAVSPQRLRSFAARQGLYPWQANSAPVIAYLRVTRTWRVAGVFGGIVISGFVLGAVTLNSFGAIAGWFAGVLLAEDRLAAGRTGRRGDGPPLLSTEARVFHAVTVGMTLALVGATVVRSFTATVPATERISALGGIVVLLAAHFQLWSLRTPEDSDAVDVAIRRRSAQVLATGGGGVAVMCALPYSDGGVSLLVAGVVLLLAVIIGMRPWRPPVAVRGLGPALAAGAALATAAALWTYGTAAHAPPPAAYGGKLAGPAVYAVRADCGRTGPCAGWYVHSADGTLRLDRAAPEPFALSPSGTQVAYLDLDTHRLVAQELATGRRHELAGAATPSFSPDGGRVASLTGNGVQLVDLRTGAERVVPGLGRIVGLGRDTMVATTGPMARDAGADVELVTVGFDGGVRSRVPFDPTLAAWLEPEGERVLVLTEGAELALLDARTGKPVARRPLRMSRDDRELYLRPELAGWAADGRALVRTDDRTDVSLKLIDLRTGKVSPVDQAFPSRAVFAGIQL